MRVVTSYNNFSRGKLDHDIQGRFDLQIYNTGSDVFRNFISNFKGNAIYRTGFEMMVDFEDCVLHEFIFSDSQSYLLVFYHNKIRFLSYDGNDDFGWVLDGSSNILEVTTPYTLSECRELDFTQNADVMVITHQSHPPKNLTRIAANDFTFSDHLFSDSETVGGNPFNQRVVNITGATQANPCVITSSTHGLRDGDRVTIASVGGMTELNGNTYIIRPVNANTFQLVGVDSTGFTAYTSGGTATRALANPAVCCFYGGRLFFGNTSNRPTSIWGSESGNYSAFAIPGTIDSKSPLQFTIADITQPIEWLFGGDNSLIVGSRSGIVAVNGGNVGDPIAADTVEATITSADGCNSAYPIRKDGLLFYMGRNDRNMYYFNYDLLTESFTAKDANFTSFDITIGGVQKIRYKKDRNDLIFGVRGDGLLVSLNFRSDENITGWHDHDTYGDFLDIGVITDNYGNPQLFALVRRNGDYFIERHTDYQQFAERVGFFSGDEKADDEAHNRFVAEQMMRIVFLDNANIIDSLRTGNPIVYDPVGGTITANSAAFTSNDVGRHISFQTVTGYDHGRFEITAYNSDTEVDVLVLQEPTVLGAANWYMSFQTISGLTDYVGHTIAVVTDGGYVDDFDVDESATIMLPDKALCAVVGYKYTGVIKSFCLGFQIQAENTQTTMKAITRVGVRAVSSMGGKIGTTLYRLQDVQELSQNDINYLPPIPIDGTKYVSYVDDNEKDKYFYLVQDQPVPFVAACVMVDANYVGTR